MAQLSSRCALYRVALWAWIARLAAFQRLLSGPRVFCARIYIRQRRGRGRAMRCCCSFPPWHASQLYLVRCFSSRALCSHLPLEWGGSAEAPALYCALLCTRLLPSPGCIYTRKKDHRYYAWLAEMKWSPLATPKRLRKMLFSLSHSISTSLGGSSSVDYFHQLAAAVKNGQQTGQSKVLKEIIICYY